MGVGRKYILFCTDLFNSEAESQMLILREKTRKQAYFIFSHRNTLLTSHNMRRHGLTDGASLRIKFSFLD
jgi:hypothetical protein